MKKLLLSLVAIVVAMTASADLKTVTFDLTNAGNFGLAVPAPGTGTKFLAGMEITSGLVKITATPAEGAAETAMRFYQSKDGESTFRMALKSGFTITASGRMITKIVLVGRAGTTGNAPITTTNIEVLTSDNTWEGEEKSVTMMRANGTIDLTAIEVTYDATVPKVEGTFDDLYVPLKFDGVNYQVNDEWANAVIDQENGKSEVAFNTANIDFVAVGGTTPKDVELAVGEPFTGWQEWNEVKWDRKSQNLDDVKTMYFAYVVGTGNPVVGLDAEEITTDDLPTGRWRPLYTYYGPVEGNINGKNYKRELPQQGLYYEFAAKKDGHLKIAVWSNKGNRNTFVIDKETMDPVTFTCEGYINGQNEPDPKNAEKTKKRWLTNEEIQEIHKNKYCYADAKNEDGTTKKDEEGNVIKEEIDDPYPYVLGDGGQNFWGYLVMDLKAGQTYLLFQDSSQIGFGGFQFTDGKVAEGDLFSAEATVFPSTPGDANDDGSISVADLALMASYILGEQVANINLEAADVNGDGDITVADLAALANMILGSAE